MKTIENRMDFILYVADVIINHVKKENVGLDVYMAEDQRSIIIGLISEESNTILNEITVPHYIKDFNVFEIMRLPEFKSSLKALNFKSKKYLEKNGGSFFSVVSKKTA